MIRINGMGRTAAVLHLERQFRVLDIKIGVKGYNRVGWEHEHEGFTIIGEFSPFNVKQEDRVVFAIYGRER